MGYRHINENAECKKHPKVVALMSFMESEKHEIFS